MTVTIHDQQFVIKLDNDGKVVSKGSRSIPLGTAVIVRDPPKEADTSFWEWMMETWREDKTDPLPMPLCAGARIKVDENGDGTLTIDESLPDGVWLVEKPTKTYRLSGVTGPVRVRSEAQDGEDVEVSPVAMTFETRKP